jgi:predicted transcriptional regulator
MPRKVKSKADKSDDTIELDEAALLAAASENGLEPEIPVFRPDREGIRKVLGDLEADVMEYVWEKYSSSATSNQNEKGIIVREVYEQFRLHRTIAYTTVMTTMARLARKHLLSVRRVDNTYIYTPNLSKEEFIDNFVARILENLLVSFADTTESHLQRLVSETETVGKIDHLRSRLNRLQNQRTSHQAHTSKGEEKEEES